MTEQGRARGPASKVNHATYADAGVVATYSTNRRLHPAEERILADLADELAVARLLDLGIGAGRTVGPFSARVRTYIGLDYVPEMVEAARASFPHHDLRTGDARDLAGMADDEFDAVVFSFNGIDYVDQAGREQILAEIRRVLRPGGVFVFSTHNREYRRRGLLPWQGRPRPGRELARRSLHALRHRAQRRAMRALAGVEGDHIWVNDDAHDYRLLTYYIAPSAQVAQLGRAGFGSVEIRNQQGVPSNSCSESVWMYYVVRG